MATASPTPKKSRSAAIRTIRTACRRAGSRVAVVVVWEEAGSVSRSRCSLFDCVELFGGERAVPNDHVVDRAAPRIARDVAADVERVARLQHAGVIHARLVAVDP